MSRVIAYVDGFNLYYAMKHKRWQRFYWLNIQSLVLKLLKPTQDLVCTKYFTSRVSATPWDPEKSKRQNAYLEALGTLDNFQMFFGHYLGKTIRCHACDHQWDSHEEKMTDVNIAVQLMTDTFQDRLDTALLMSADSDLTGPIEAVRHLFPEKRVVVAFPPFRHSVRLHQAANATFTIGRASLARSQFPERVRKADGHQLTRPASWR